MLQTFSQLNSSLAASGLGKPVSTYLGQNDSKYGWEFNGGMLNSSMLKFLKYPINGRVRYNCSKLWIVSPLE